MAAEVIDRDWEEFKTKFNTKSQIDLNQYKPAQMPLAGRFSNQIAPSSRCSHNSHQLAAVRLSFLVLTG